MGRRFMVVCVLAVLPSVGCARDTEEDCKTMCKWAEDCGGGEAPGCVDNCVKRMKKADDDCHDALGDFADCVDGEKCSDDDDCGGEAAGLLGDCAEYF